MIVTHARHNLISNLIAFVEDKHIKHGCCQEEEDAHDEACEVWVKSIQLQVNELTGPIPAVLGTLINLEKLFLQNNQLTGAVPYRVATLPRLSQLFVDKPE